MPAAYPEHGTDWRRRGLRGLTKGRAPLFEQAFRNIDDVLRKDAGSSSELDYVEQTSWLLFLKYLDALEQDRAMEAALEGRAYDFILAAPYRWAMWAAPAWHFCPGTAGAISCPRT